MRRLLCALVLLPAAGPLRAADEPRPNTLTAREIADGWVLLFDGETTFGLKTEGEVKVADGALVLGGEKASRVLTTCSFGDFELRLEYRFEEGRQRGQLRFDRTVNATIHDLPALAGGLPVWHEGVFRVEGRNETGNYKGGLDGKAEFAKKFTAAAGRTTLAVQVPEENKLSLRNVKLRPLGGQSLFNDKDLTGWKQTGKKAKFSVTKEGWLSVLGGPGDLLSEGQWADFVLQLECVTNVQHTQSGVFFRCGPGESPPGYHVQVRNHFREQPTQEYTLEEYDPKTGELKEKKKAKFHAVEYGTGGLVGHVPARRRVVTDYEWCTLTVLAQGRHLAVWVNGVLVTDWTDNRKTADNAGKGCYLEKGGISLHGHDGTTDVNCRNIRITELP